MHAKAWVPGMPDVGTLLEAIYAFEETEWTPWLERIRAAVAATLPGTLGVLTHVYRVVDKDVQFLAVAPVEAATPAAVQQATEQAPVFLTQPPVYFGRTLLEAGRAGALPALLQDGVIAEMPRDVFMVFASDGRCGGAIGVLLPEYGGPLSDKEHDAWMRISAHFAAAIRLRVFGVPQPDLRLDEKLKVVDQNALDPDTRDALRTAARAVDKVRGRSVKDPAEALSLWRVLNERRWTIADDFDSDGRRYIVAYENAPLPLIGLPKLTLGERQVVCFAALGHTNKHIGYELGIATSTVATRLATAMRKLGVKSRPALVRKLYTS